MPKNNETLIPILTITTGVLLMIFKMYADSEPGAIPLLIIIFGGSWYFIKKRAGIKRT